MGHGWKKSKESLKSRESLFNKYTSLYKQIKYYGRAVRRAVRIHLLKEKNMKTAGIIGGTSWYSTVHFYQYINTYVGEKLGALNCAKMVLVNVNLQEIKYAPSDDAKGQILVKAAKQIEVGGGDFVVICSNGLHEYADMVQSAISIPLIHIANGTADKIQEAGFNRVGLIGIARTMEKDFYTKRLVARGMEVFIPDAEERKYIDNVLFAETGLGIVKPESSARFYEISNKLVERGAQCVILGCTEIGMLMQQEHTNIPLFDTTQIHAETVGKLCISD